MFAIGAFETKDGQDWLAGYVATDGEIVLVHEAGRQAATRYFATHRYATRIRRLLEVEGALDGRYEYRIVRAG